MNRPIIGLDQNRRITKITPTERLESMKRDHGDGNFHGSEIQGEQPIYDFWYRQNSSKKTKRKLISYLEITNGKGRK